jgi:hypothetical protein
MKPNTPILMLSLLIPVTAETNPEQVINIIGQQVVEAMQQIRAHQASAEQETEDPEAVPQDEFNATLVKETLEPYSEDTKADWLSKLGYAAAE